MLHVVGWIKRGFNISSVVVAKNIYMKKELTLVNIYAIGGDFLESVIDGFKCIIKIKKKKKMLKKS